MIQKMLLCVAVAVAVLTGSSQAQLPGSKIAYLSTVPNLSAFFPQSGTICVMDPDGGNPVDLAQVKIPLDGMWFLFPITWSPDGTQLAYQSEQDIYAVNVEGGVPVNLTHAGPDESNKYPAWSPDGTRIAFTSRRGRTGARIYLMNADGSNPVKLMDEQAEMPSWSPDGRKIAFRSTKGGKGLNNVFVMNADGTDPVQLTHETVGDVGAIAWSPDGRRIAFDVALKKTPVWHVEIDVVDLDGRNRVRVSEVPGGGNFDNESPSWSPDGSKIAFMSDRRYRHFDIWMVNPDGTDPVRVSQVKTTDPQHMFPAWSPLPGLVVAPSAVRALPWGQVKAGGQ